MLLFTSMLVVVIAQTILLAYLLHKNASNVTESYVDLRVQTAVDSVAIENVKDLSKITGKVLEVEAAVESAHTDIDYVNDYVKGRFKAFQELSDDLLDLIGGQTQLMTELEERIASIEEAFDSVNSQTAEVAQTQASVILSQMQPVDTQTNTKVEITNTQEIHTVDNGNDTTNDNVQESDPMLKPPRQDGDPLITDLRAQPFEEYKDTHGNIHDIPAQGAGYEAFESQRGQRPVRRTTMRRI